VVDAPLFIDDSPNMSMVEIRAKCRRLKQRHDLRMVIVDYLQLMTSPRLAPRPGCMAYGGLFRCGQLRWECEWRGGREFFFHAQPVIRRWKPLTCGKCEFVEAIHFSTHTAIHSLHTG